MEVKQLASQIEQLLDLAFGALLAGDVQELASLTETVLAASQQLVAADVTTDPSWIPCVRRLQLLREAIARHQVFNELKLQQLVPAFSPLTYGTGAVASARPASPYAGVARTSGRLEQVLRA